MEPPWFQYFSPFDFYTPSFWTWHFTMFHKILVLSKSPALYVGDLPTNISSFQFNTAFDINNPYKILKVWLVETIFPPPTKGYFRYFFRTVVAFMMCLLDVFLQILYPRLFYFCFLVYWFPNQREIFPVYNTVYSAANMIRFSCNCC